MGSEAEDIVHAPTHITRFWLWVAASCVVIGSAGGANLMRLNDIIAGQNEIRGKLDTYYTQLNALRTEYRENRADRLARQENADRVHVELDMRLDRLEADK